MSPGIINFPDASMTFEFFGKSILSTILPTSRMESLLKIIYPLEMSFEDLPLFERSRMVPPLITIMSDCCSFPFWQENRSKTTIVSNRSVFFIGTNMYRARNYKK